MIYGAFHNALYCLLGSAILVLLPSSIQAQTQTTPAVPPASLSPVSVLNSADRNQTLPASLSKCQIHLDLKQQPLSAFLRALQHQASVLIVADDKPLREQADLTFDGSLKEALDQVADTFDYLWSVSRHGAILLRKRFRDPADFPHLNLPEMHAIARDACTLFDNPDYVPGPTGMYTDRVIVLYRSLTDAQIQQMQDGRPIPATELSPAQFRLLRQTTYHLSFHALAESWQQFSQNLEALPQSALRFAPEPGGMYSALSWLYPDSNGQQKRRVLRYFPIEEKKQ